MKSGKRDYFYFDFENNTSGWIRRKRNQFGYIYLLCLTLLRLFEIGLKFRMLSLSTDSTQRKIRRLNKALLGSFKSLLQNENRS
jgi:hypothetical protein